MVGCVCVSSLGVWVWFFPVFSLYSLDWNVSSLSDNDHDTNSHPKKDQRINMKNSQQDTRIINKST